MRRALLSFLSSPRKRGPSDRAALNWVPAFAGMIGFVLVGCSETTTEKLKLEVKQEVISSTVENNIVLLESDFDGRSLVKGMGIEEAEKNLKFTGWNKWDGGIRVSPSGMTNLWVREPCRAAAFEYAQTYKIISNERPPKHLQLNARFYECVENKPINLGQLAEVNIKEEK